MFMESWILLVSCKVTRSPFMISWTFQKSIHFLKNYMQSFIVEHVDLSHLKKNISMKRIFKKWVRILEGSWNYEYFGSLAKLGLHVNFARDPKYSWFNEPSKNWIYCLYLQFIILEMVYNLGDKTGLSYSRIPNARMTNIWLNIENNFSRKRIKNWGMSCNKLCIPTFVV